MAGRRDLEELYKDYWLVTAKGDSFAFKTFLSGGQAKAQAVLDHAKDLLEMADKGIHEAIHGRN